MASMPRIFRSLTLRLAVLSAIWVTAGLGIAGCTVLQLINVELTNGFDGRASALLHKVAAAAGRGTRPRVSSTTHFLPVQVAVPPRMYPRTRLPPAGVFSCSRLAVTYAR